MSKAIEAPWLAKEHGMTTLVFEDDFDSLDTIDVNNTGAAGYKWYVERPYRHTTIQEGVDYKLENSVLTLCNVDHRYNYGMGTYHPTTKNGWAFCHGVLEFRLRITNPKIPAGNEGKGIPAVWSFPRNTITDDQLCWVEPDWMEYWEDGFWTTAIHEGRRDAYKGPQTYATTNTNYAGVGPLGDGEWHTLTYLWTEDRIESYLDGNPSMVFTYGSGVAEPPVRQKVGESRNDQYFPLKWEPQTLIIGGSETAPLELDWIRVWQRPLKDVRE